MNDAPDDREIVVSRRFDAPRELIFAAFTEREHIEQWWIPPGATIEAWEGGAEGSWRYNMTGPDGHPMPFKIRYIERDEPGRLVYEYGADIPDGPSPVRTTVTFDEQGGKTDVTLRLRFATAAEREQAIKHGARGGAKQALNGLAAYLEG